MDRSTFEYELAEGPEGLRAVLDRFYDRAQQDKAFAAVGHYILYKLGGQKSLIKVDMSKEPFQFWYNDLLGRPATKLVKDTITLFLSERCNLSVNQEAQSEVK